MRFRMFEHAIGEWSEHLLIARGLGRGKPRNTVVWSFDINKNDESINIEKNKESRIVDVET